MYKYKNYVIVTDENDRPIGLTTIKNWESGISDARAIRSLNDFETIEQVKHYIDNFLEAKHD